MAKTSSRGSGLPESTTATLAWRQRRVGRPGLGNVSASVGAGTGSGGVVEVRRWLGSICAATCLRSQTPVIKGETSPALECPITRAPDGVVSREGGRLAGQTNDRWCHEGVVRTHTSVCDGRGRSVTTGTARCRWKRNGQTQSRDGIPGPELLAPERTGSTSDRQGHLEEGCRPLADDDRRRGASTNLQYNVRRGRSTERFDRRHGRENL